MWGMRMVVEVVMVVEVLVLVMGMAVVIVVEVLVVVMGVAVVMVVVWNGGCRGRGGGHCGRGAGRRSWVWLW